jgi:hypothetical protein
LVLQKSLSSIWWVLPVAGFRVVVSGSEDRTQSRAKVLLARAGGQRAVWTVD